MQRKVQALPELPLICAIAKIDFHIYLSWVKLHLVDGKP